MITAGKPIKSLTVQLLDYLRDENGKKLKFENAEEAKEYLKSKKFTDDEIRQFVFQEIDKYFKIGSYIPQTNDTAEIIGRDEYGEGLIFKDEEAYKTSLDKVCYIPELSDTKYTRKDFLDIVENQENIADNLFYNVDWQHPESLLQDYYASGEVDDCTKCGKIFACYDKKECPHCHAPYDAEWEI